MRQVLCSQLIGREEEMALLAESLAAAHTGHGHALILVGEAGVGKSRLAREIEALAHESGDQILRGRATEGPTAPYRPLAEALLAGLRESKPPDVPELRPFRPILGRLIPEWRAGEAQTAGISSWADDSLVLLGEAILRLLRVFAGRTAVGSARPTSGCSLLILEDLHWADVDTLAVIEYLIDNLATEPVLLLGTIRSEEESEALRLAHRMAARRAGGLVELPRLDRTGVERMTRVCLTAPDEPPNRTDAPTTYPESVVDLLVAYTEGLPFLVEELLAAWIDSGALLRGPDGWEAVEELRPVTPLTFADMVNRRLAAVGQEGASLLELAAIQGHHFDWTLLPPASGLHDRGVLDCLQSAIDAQLVVSTPAGPNRASFAFRHALIRTAILARLLPPQRADLSARMLTVIEQLHPGLPAEWCDLAAGLAEAAGKSDRAAELLLQSGRQAVARGALATAESVLDRAGNLAPENGPLWCEAMEALGEALSLAGKWERVFAVGERLLTVLERQPGQQERCSGVYLRMARAALAAAGWDEASRYLDAAWGHIADSPPAGLLAQLDALRAHLAVERARLDEAAAFAQSALDGAERTAQPEVACEALEVLGRCARVHDLDRAAAAFERARAIAEENGLSIWRIRAMHELGTLDIFSGCRLDRLLEARTLASEAGALATAAMVDIQIAAVHSNRGEFQEELAVARRSREMARRFHLSVTEAAALLFEATAYGHLGRRREMEAAIGEALRLAGNEPDIVAGIWEARAFASLMEEKRARALSEVEMAMAATAGLPATTPGPYRGLWALLRTIEGEDGPEACEVVRESGATILPINCAYLSLSEAITLGRSGQGEKAATTVRQAHADLAGREWFRSLGLRLVAEVALQDGWGDPAAWLWEAYTCFEPRGYERVAAACKALLRRAGVTVAPGGRSYSGVPAHFRALGITRREMDVLALVADGLSNREVGERLYLSPRTVEKHVASLLAKTDTRTRAQLAALAVAPTASRQ
jgi:DNA-binding CsgD family transcriptional regulator/tetratricopeptide (TPR) repeat protein